MNLTKFDEKSTNLRQKRIFYVISSPHNSSLRGTKQSRLQTVVITQFVIATDNFNEYV